MRALLAFCLLVVGIQAATFSYTLAPSTTGTLNWVFTSGASGNNPDLKVNVGDVLTFNVDTNSGVHPFSVHTTNSPGTGTNRYSGLTVASYSGTGAMPSVTIGKDVDGAILYYCCEVHSSMVGRILVGTAGSGTPAPAPTPAAMPMTTPAPQLDICRKYATALKVTQTALMTTIVSAVVGAELKDPALLAFFNGTSPPGSIDFTKNTAQFNRLAGDLIAFFGAALGCTDPAFPKYTGNPDMHAVHMNMPIDQVDFGKFNDIFVSTAASLGVSTADQTDLRNYLNFFAPMIVNPTLICPKYASALKVTQTALMTTIVSAVVGAELKDPVLLGFFNGTVPAGSIDFTKNTAQYNRLAGDLIAFFGGALGCNDPAFPKYTGNPDMQSVHMNMPIGATEFNKFNTIFINTLTGLGVTGPDTTTVRAVLDSFYNQIVHPTVICPKYANALKVTQTQLMTTVVGKVVELELADSRVKPFFNGTLPAGSIDFTTNTAQFNRLAGDLVAFFGIPLGCTDPAFPKYTGNPDMHSVHGNMPIDLPTFQAFNTNFMNALTVLGVGPDDVDNVGRILKTFQSQIVGPLYICPKYAKALGVTETALMTTIVSAVVGGELKDPVLLGFFNGTSPPGSIDFTTNTAQYTRLATNLVSFFGAALGCKDPSFPAYAGNPDMKAVHMRMPISQVEFDKFNAIFIDTLAGLGVTSDDRALVYSILYSFQPLIVNPTYICPKYAKALGVTETALMTTIVTAVVGAELADPAVRVFFDGTTPTGSTNFTAPSNSAQYNRLAGDLVAFFGSALGCFDSSFPAYTGNADMQSVHAAMPITQAVFDKFNTNFIGALTKLGVTATDTNMVLMVLNSFASKIVHDNPLPPPTPVTPPGPPPAGGSRTYTLAATTSGALNWGFTGGATGNNPTLYANPGDVLTFNVNTQGSTHPFSIHTTMSAGSSSNRYSGVVPQVYMSSKKRQGGSVLTIGAGMAGMTLYYVCENHPTMVGAIMIGNGSPLPPPAPTICAKYAMAKGISQTALMTAIVTAVVKGELADPSILQYFNGTTPAGSTDFTTDTKSFNKLAGDLVAFFGNALGCNDPSFPTYTGNPDMKAVHAAMMIPQSDFDKFNMIFIGVLASLGVSSDDQNTILGVLKSFGPQIVAGGGGGSGSGGMGDPDLIAMGYQYYQGLDCSIGVYWMPYDASTGMVSFAVRRPTTGNIGLGFPVGTALQMIGSDAVIGWVPSGSAAVVNTYYLGGKALDASQVVPNSKLSVTATGGMLANGITTLFFTRPIKAGFNPIADPTAVTIIASSLDGVDGIGYHSCRVQQSYIINLVSGGGSTGSTSVSDPLRDTHGALMLVGWGIFLVLGVLTARYGKGLGGDWWFILHQFFQITGFVMVSAGFTIAWIMTNGAHFNTRFHSQFGLSIMIVGYLQFFGGLMRPHKPKEGQSKSALRTAFEFLHPWTGRLLLVAACVNIFAGISTWWHWWVHILYALIVAFFVLVILFCELSGSGKKAADDAYHAL